jgi:hypothetical protein
MQVTLSDAFAKLQNTDKPFVEVFKHGTLSVELYQPVGKDLQTPHERDEVYVRW